jgi:antitoxin PrlF
MSTATLTSKGQVTIPKPVRDALGLHTGDRIAFVVRSDGVVEIRPETVDLKRLYGSLAYRGRAIGVEAMDGAVLRSVAEDARKR